jgi:hypothetical protein
MWVEKKLQPAKWAQWFSFALRLQLQWVDGHFARVMPRTPRKTHKKGRVTGTPTNRSTPLILIVMVMMSLHRVAAGRGILAAIE